MRAINKLTPLKIAALSKPGLHADGNNLYLQVAQGGSKSWVFRFYHDGRARKMGLGSIRLVPLKEAREKAVDQLRLVRLDDVDPIEGRKAMRAAKRIAAAKGITFRQCADKYIESHKAGWKNAKHASQWNATLNAYVHPMFGDLPVPAVDVGLVLKALEPIWNEKSETASRVRGRIESILDWAAARGYRAGDNPARWRGHLDHLLPARNKVAKVKHHPALPYVDMGEFMAGLRTMDGVSPRALEFAILTATRTGETIGARWPELDLNSRMWTIPPERMKAGKEHRVPLSDRAIELVATMPRDIGSDLVFIGDKKGRALSTWRC